MAKADNMMAILWLLRTRRRMTGTELAEALEISIRTVYRYIDALCASGVPIVAESGHDGGYSLLESFRDAPLVFDSDEQKALMQAAVFAQEAGYPYSAALQRAVGKLMLYSGPERQEEMEKYAGGIGVIHPPADPALAQTLKRLESAAAEGLSLLMEYGTNYSSTFQERRIDPYGLVFWKSRWYTVAYCHLRSAIRSFRVDRIRRIDDAAEGAAAVPRPEKFSARDFFLRNLLPEGEREESRPGVTVRLAGRMQALNDLCEHWLLSYGIVERKPEEVIFRLDQSAVEKMLPSLLLGYGSSLRVLEPDSLRRRLADAAAELAAFHGAGRSESVQA